MRSPAPTAPARKGKQRLMASCAIAAGMAALALGGPALAQVAGNGVVVTGAGPGGTATIRNPTNGAPPNTTQVIADTSQTIINWTPTDTDTDAALGAIDFLSTGNTLEFYGTGQYTVLNRFIGPAAAVRPIGLNGTVNSYIGSPFATGGNTQGGNIWFYNAGGILIGANATINVGSLVLTANDIDTTGGLLGPAGIRFRGASGSTAGVEIAAGADITASNGNPGNSYVALVAPRVIQSGVVNVDGSVAYVAAEQADIRINNGLFDINVLVGAEGGTVLTHSGTTTGPAHQQGDVDQSRIYMVAIPKNDAVTMLVGGQIGYQDAAVAQMDPDGAVRLSAGYDIVAGELADTPDNATAANMGIADTIFQSSVTARASGALVAGPFGTLPTGGGGGPVVAVPPPQIGRLVVQGDGIFVGDASATLNVGANQIVGATGNLTVTSGGANGQSGNASANITGGNLLVLGDLNVDATGQVLADGSSLGGTALLSVTGGAVNAGSVTVSSVGAGGIGAGGDGGTGTGGDASILVSGAGSSLTADTVSILSQGLGGGVTFSMSGEASAVDNGGDGVGGTATLTVENGGSLTANDLLSVAAVGEGRTGVVQSGTGTGGTARIDLTGSGSSIDALATLVAASGTGGSDLSQVIFADVVTANAGAGIGGSAIIALDGDSSTLANLGDTTMSADGTGGGARGTDPAGGDGRGGTASLTVTGGMQASPTSLTISVTGNSGGASGEAGEVETSGDAVGGTINLTANSNSVLSTVGGILLDASGISAIANNKGSSSGGTITVQATGGGTIQASQDFVAQASAGQMASTVVTSVGSSTGGTIDFIADGGIISGEFFDVSASASTQNVDQTGGAAQGGTINLLASNNGTISATNPDQFSFFSVDAFTGFSAGGADATGGTIQGIADGGTLNFAGSAGFFAGGVSGGDSNFIAVPRGRGGSILFQTLASTSGVSTIRFSDLFASSDGSAGATIEGTPALDDLGSADGEGGNVTVDIQDGIFSGNSAFFSASGFGGAVAAGSGTGRGGTAIFTQSGGDVDVGDLSVDASGTGGFDLTGGPGGTGIGGTATIDLLAGTMDAVSISASASGFGGLANSGDDDLVDPRTATDGGNGQGGTATINIDGTAVVNTDFITASAGGFGADGGSFFSFNDQIGDTGSGGTGTGGSANINLIAGSLTTDSLVVDATGLGGFAGSLFSSSSSGGPTGTGIGGSGGDGQGGIATLTQSGGTAVADDVIVDASGTGGDTAELGGVAGDGSGGTATANLNDGTLDNTSFAVLANGIGGTGLDGSDDFFDPAVAGDGGNGTGGLAEFNLDGTAVISTDDIDVEAMGVGGNGGNFQTFLNTPADTGSGGNGAGGSATVNLVAGDLTTDDLDADAGGVGGDGGNLFGSSSSGSPTSAGIGGSGGSAQGGLASIDFRTAIVSNGTVTSSSTASGGTGGNNSVGGNGGGAFGGEAQVLVTDLDAGALEVVIDTSAAGGNGGIAFNGGGGDGGDAQGGIGRVQVDGIDGNVAVSQGNFVSTVTGGNGGDAALVFGSGATSSPAGGDGGFATGGTIQIVANGGTATLVANPVTGVASLGSTATGGNGGRGADNSETFFLPGPDGMLGTIDDQTSGYVGGDGGLGGGGTGGTVQLVANGGTITSDGAPVDISVSGTSGNGGDGGTGFLGTGSCCSSFVDEGGNVIIEAVDSSNGPSQILLGDTTIDASGFIAGRVNIINQGEGSGINFSSLDVTVFGFPGSSLPPTTFDRGIRFASADGQIVVDGDATLNSDAEIRFDMDGNGQLSIGGSLNAFSSSRIAATHINQVNFNPGVTAGGDINFDSAGDIISDQDSQFSANGDINFNASQNIDIAVANAGNNTTLISNGGTNASAASAGGEVYAEGGSVSIGFAISGGGTTLISTGSDAFFGSIESGGSTLINSFAGVFGGDINAGADVTIDAGTDGQIFSIFSGDDIRVNFGGSLVIGTMGASSFGFDDEGDGANIVIGAGDTEIDHAEADNDFIADVGSFTTGLNSIITGGDILITSPGAVDLGNSTAGGFVSVDGQSIVFNTIDAGTTVGLTATGVAPGGDAIFGNRIDAGDNVTLIGNSIRINDGVFTTDSLFATASGGNARLSATTDGDIVIDSSGDIAGTYAAGGNVSLTAATNITAQATAAGTYVGPNGPSEGYLFIDAAGDANILAGTSAATMIGVAAGTDANVDGASAGEDLYVVAGNAATVTNSTAGDDMIVTGTCCVIVGNVSTTGAGPDGRSLLFAPATAGGPDVWQIQTGPTDLSNITLTASAGTIDASNAVAFDNLTATASDVVTTTNTIRSGLVTAITGSSLNLESITAGTDIILESTAGDISAIGALSAGHDLTATSAAAGSFADLSAGDDIRIAASGDVSAASLLTTAGGLDNESDFSGAYIDTPGSITVTGTTNTAGQTRLTAGGTVDTGAITADYTFIDATGAINATGDITSGGMFIEGSSVDILNAQGNSGDIVLRATDSDVTVDGNVTTLASLLVEAADAISITGAASGNNFVQMTGGSIDVADVDSSTFVFLTSTSGQINSSGTISAGTDVILDAATGGQLSALVAGDDVSINAGGDVTIASMSADGSNPQGEEEGSNVAGTVNGTLTVTGSTFAASDVTFDATSIALQDVEAGGAFNATTTGGPLTLTSADAGTAINLTSASTVLATGTLQSGAATTVTGDNLDLQSVVAGTNVDLTATAGNIVTGGDVSGLNVSFDATGDIDHDNDSLLSAGNDLTLVAGGDIDVGNASSGGDMNFDAGGAIAANALSSDRNILLGASGLIELAGDVDAALTLRADGGAIELNDIAVDAGGLGLTASTGGVNATGTINANGPLTVFAVGAVDMTGDINAAAFASIQGASVTVGNVTGGNSISLIATDGAVNSAGTIDAGANIFISTTAGGNFDRLIAGDDIGIAGSGDVEVAFMDATGANPEGEEIGSNVDFDLDGNVTVGHGEAAGDFTVNANSFSTGLNSIIADNNIVITTSGASNLGNSTAGGSIQVDAQSIAFNALDAGDFVNLNATGTTFGAEGIGGGSILAGTDVILIGNSIAVGTIEAGGLLSAFGSGGDVAIDNATAASNIGVTAANNIAGVYAAGGDIEMSAGGDIAITAIAAGGAPDPSNGDVNTAGNLFIDAAGNVTLTGGGAGMVGVRAGGSAALTGVTAGEDMLVLTGTTAGLSSITVGDDLDVIAGDDVSAFGVSATAEGPDGFQLAFSSTSGFTIGQGEGVSSTDGADIDIRSTGGAVQAGGLSAGDDIFLTAASALSVSGATTRGLGQTGGDSSIRTQSGSATLAGLDAFTDVVVQSDGAVGITGPVRSGRDTSIAADNVTVATLTQVTAGNTVLIDTIVAGRDLGITAAGAVDTGALRAGRDLAITGGTTVNVLQAVNGAGGTLTLGGADGVTGDRVTSGGATNLTSSDGAIEIATLSSAGPVTASGDSIRVTGNGNLIFSQLDTDVGDAFVSAGGDLSVTAGSVAGGADLGARSGDLSVTQLTANSVRLESDDDMTLGTVTAAETLLGEAGGVLTVNGAVVGQQISLGSADIAIAANGRLGTQGVTTVLDVRNTDEDATTFVGGTGARDGYHIDAGEMARLFGTDVTIFAPVIDGNDSSFVASAPGALPVPIASVGSSTAPAVVIDDFTMTAGSSSSNLGASGSLTIATPGKARVIGDVSLTGMSDANSLRITADEALEVILGEGTIRLTGGSSTSGASTPGGMLFLESEDVIVATADAIADVAAASDIDAIDERLGQNDGIVLDDGALFAGGIDVSVVGGFYVQNSGTGTAFAERRGLTFGPLGLNVNVEGSDSRIVINGVHLGPSGQVTGLDTIPLLSIDGFVIGSGPLSGSGLAFDSGSTMNGCLIVSSTSCSFVEFESSFPVQDVINDEEDDEEQDGDDAEGMSLPTPLITMRDLDPLTGEPLLDDPVTGAGNDDLWTPPAE